MDMRRVAPLLLIPLLGGALCQEPTVGRRDAGPARRSVAQLIRAIRTPAPLEADRQAGLELVAHRSAAVLPLADFLAHSEVHTCGHMMAYAVIKEIGRDAVRPLTRLLQTGDGPSREIAASLLGRIGSKAMGARSALEAALLSDRRPRVRQAAAYALGDLGSTATAALVEVLDDADPELRRAALDALATTSPPLSKAPPELLRAIAAREAGERAIAASALGNVASGGAEVMAALRRALADEDCYVRKAAASSVGKIAPPDRAIIRSLRRAIHDDDDCATDDARVALRQVLARGNASAQ